MEHKELLIQKSNRDGSVLNIGRWNGKEYETEYGTIHDQLDIEYYNYKYMNWSDLRAWINEQVDHL